MTPLLFFGRFLIQIITMFLKKEREKRSNPCVSDCAKMPAHVVIMVSNYTPPINNVSPSLWSISKKIQLRYPITLLQQMTHKFCGWCMKSQYRLPYPFGVMIVDSHIHFISEFIFYTSTMVAYLSISSVCFTYKRFLYYCQFIRCDTRS